MKYNIGNITKVNNKIIALKYLVGDICIVVDYRYNRHKSYGPAYYDYVVKLLNGQYVGYSIHLHECEMDPIC